ncbi:hypothetical protein A3I57_00080 [Candidatus Beckwithbacteria bacterium RIFCSPLOWO2_02_FULL_47_23]|uniref:Glycosyltransferase RgtA/B/C/D-like domain-containing protein n=1 Tax=Candidatus Beckwithbacteria bacterium RIFCSPLOWO2_02_FULL_47_23 TaxID=1797463 RepID=A0A1F5E1Y9_9BACT|nr:MAG: hypothetical protein A3I57_00080 [Candidatus Beckwithbacteria bacterium RIFCSPLOWO2_02_FULL_47_23]
MKLLLWLVLIKSLAWALFIPLWHFPDEQAHFGHVAYLAEGGTLPMGRTNDLNQEIAISEQRLGTYRNKYGNNSFTYQPDYRLEYTDSLEGLYEAEIKSLPLSTRKEFKDPESAYYPHFFYRVSGLIYKLFYNQDIFIRVFALRLFWLFGHVFMVWLAWLIGKEVFPKDPKAAVTVAVLTSFQPMLSFVAAGVTGDNLHNLLFTAVIYFCLKLRRKLAWKNLLGLTLVMILGFINKPQFLIALGIVVPILFRRWKKILGLIGLAAIWLYLSGKLPYFEIKADLARPDYTLWQHLVYTAQHTFREVLPWYWGVFRWLSLTLPRWVNQVMMRILLIAGIGLAIKCYRKKFDQGFWLIIWSAAVYFLALFFWDFQQVRNSGFPFGIQGRYYFPVIVPHMVLLVMGLRQITNYLLLITGYWFITLNWIAFYWVTASYYDTSGFKTFIIQASQYKPDFAKGAWLAAVLFLYAILTLIFSIKLLKNEK